MDDRQPPILVPTKTQSQLLTMLAVFAPLFEAKTSIDTRLFFNDEEQRYELRVGGFYKHGDVTVYPVPSENFVVRGLAGDDYEVMGRYGKIDTVVGFDDLVNTNYHEWLSFRDRGFELDRNWLPFILAKGLVAKKVETKVTYEPN